MDSGTGAAVLELHAWDERGRRLAGVEVRCLVRGSAVLGGGEARGRLGRRRVLVLRPDPWTGQPVREGSLGRRVFAGATDASGILRLEGLPSRADLQVQVRDRGTLHELGTQHLSPGQVQRLDWSRPEEPLVLEGRVCDASGAGVEGCQVLAALRLADVRWLDGERSALTGPDGRFSIGPLPVATYGLRASSPDGRSASGAWSGPGSDLRLVLE